MKYKWTHIEVPKWKCLPRPAGEGSLPPDYPHYLQVAHCSFFHPLFLARSLCGALPSLPLFMQPQVTEAVCVGVQLLTAQKPINRPCWWKGKFVFSQFSSVAQSCPTLCDPTDCSMPGFAVYHQQPEFTQTHVHWVSNSIQPSHPLSSPSPSAFSLSQHRGLFKWVSSSHQVGKVLEFQLQHQSFQWIFRTDFL